MSKESQKAFYTAQRIKAEKSGDTKTTTKIYDKLNKAEYGEGQKLRDAKSTASQGDALQADRVAGDAKDKGQSFLSKFFGGK